MLTLLKWKKSYNLLKKKSEYTTKSKRSSKASSFRLSDSYDEKKVLEWMSIINLNQGELERKEKRKSKGG